MKHDWKYSIDIKSKFTQDSDNNIIKNLSQDLIQQLNKIKSSLPVSKFKADEINCIDEILDNILCDLFDLIELCDNDTDPDENETIFNDILSDLYDIADSKFVTNSGETEKLIWIY